MDQLTIKQENFAQKYVELGNASEAYRQSYNAENMADKTIHEKACIELAKGKVWARVEELKAEHAQRHAVTVDTITQELEEARAVAIQEKQSSAAVSASMGKAKIHGLADDKVKHSGDVTITYIEEIHSAGNQGKES